MRQIAGEVGVQVGALYNYTSDKQSLLFGLMKSHLDELLAAYAALPKPESPADRLDVFVRFHIDHHLDRFDAVFIANMELRNLTPDNFAQIDALRSSYETELETILRDGVREGAFETEDPKLATMAVIAMLTGVISWYRETGRLSRDTVIQTYCAMVRKLVTSAGGA